jgi:DNA polymerase
MTPTEQPGDATPFLPQRRSLQALRAAAAGCRGCHLHAAATQTVFGEGPAGARLAMVGEVPGDHEDREGRVFVGPAGRELDRALERVGIDRRDVYITNVVKHFKFEERGKRRIHQTPKKSEVDACFPWLREELEVVGPEVLVILGATAGKALLGSGFRLGAVRGRPIDSALAPFVTATTHPSAILRARGDEARHAGREAFTADLAVVAEALAEGREPRASGPVGTRSGARAGA